MPTWHSLKDPEVSTKGLLKAYGSVCMSEGVVMSDTWYGSAQNSVGCPILRPIVHGRKRAS